MAYVWRHALSGVLAFTVASSAHGQRTGAKCVGVVAPTDSIPRDSTWHPAEPDRIGAPPMQDVPKTMHGRTVSVRFLIGVSGSPDSVDIKGFVDPDYLPRLTAALLKYHFRPAIADGCRVRAWDSPIVLAFH
jgi:hypothetical protein